MSKVIQFTITDRNYKIIESFTKKHGSSKSEVVNRAIEHLAGQYHRKLIISYELADDKKADEISQRQESVPYETQSDEEFKKEVMDWYEKLEDKRTRMNKPSGT